MNLEQMWSARAAELSASKGLTGGDAADFQREYVNASKAEHQRIKTILQHPAAASNYSEAKRLALETDTPAEAAIEQLNALDPTAAAANAILNA